MAWGWGEGGEEEGGVPSVLPLTGDYFFTLVTSYPCRCSYGTDAQN